MAADTETAIAAEKAQTAERIETAKGGLKQAIRALADIRAETGGSRELSTAQTNAETALMWLKAHGHDGIWKE